MPPRPMRDVNGDGVADWVQVVRGGDPYQSAVQIVDGASGTVIRTIGAPIGLSGFGQGVYGIPVAAGSAAPDLAVVSVNDLDQPVITLYSGSTGLADSTITVVASGGSGTYSIAAMGDLDGDGYVTLNDLVLAINYYTSGATGEQIAQADFDGDGVLSQNDVLELTYRLGMSVDDVSEYDFVAGLPAIIGIDTPAPSGEEEVDGLIGCFSCSIRCAKWLNKAVDCVAKAPCPWDFCLAKFPDSTSEDFVDCFRNARFTIITGCLSSIASSAGSCGSWVYKCGPQP